MWWKRIEDDRIVEYREITVHSFNVSDVDDPILYAAEPLRRWEQSEQGQWIMKHAIETPSWHQIHDPSQFYTKFHIRAKLSAKDITFFQLKWGNPT